MKVTLFERWRRNGAKQRQTRKPRLRPRHLQLESLEQRELLTANSAFSSYDVNHDGFLNVLDVMKVVGYVNTHGSTSVGGSSAGSGSSQAMTASASSTSSTNSAAGLDLNRDGFINVLDIIDEVKAFDVVTPQMAYTLVPTDASDTPLAGPITVGQTYFIDVEVQDLRNVSYAGVASGEVDVALAEQGGGTLGTQAIAPAAGSPNPLPNTANFPVPSGALHGDVTSSSTLFSNIQGSENFVSDPQTGLLYYPQLGTGTFVLDRIAMTATAPGVVNFSTQLSAGEPNVLASGTGLKDINDSLVLANNQISLGTTSVTIVPVPPTPGTISGKAYIDANGNNSLDGGEVGQAGVTIQLLNASNTVVNTTTTAADGTYSFTNITPGTYSIHELQPSGLFETGVNVGLVSSATDGTASGTDTVTGITLAQGAAGTGYNFALQQPATISGTEYVDANGDSVFDTGDTPLAGVTINLLGPGGSVQSFTTGANGTYSFTNLLPGTYAVHEVDPGGVYETVANVGTVNGTTTGTASSIDEISSIVLGSGATGAAYNFGVAIPGTISGTEYIDSNGDNQLDNGESGLAGVTIQLLNAANQVIGTPQVTDSNGNYTFTGVPPGTYSVHELQPTSPFVETTANIGTVNGTTTGAQSGFDTISGITLGSSAVAANYNFGVQNHTPSVVKYALLATDASDHPITGTIPVGQVFYIDVLVQDLRGVTYAGVASGDIDMAYVEQGGGTVGVTPTGNILPNTVSYPVPSSAAHGDSTSTPGLVANIQGTENLSTNGAIGFYQPLGGSALVLDRIEVTATSPGVVNFNTQFSAGENTILASGTGVQDINDSVLVPTSQIISGATQVTIIPTPATLSGTVYVDSNSDNTQESGEAGLAGVTVQLINSSQVVIASQTTDSSGHYTFNTVPVGTYSVHEVQPSGFFETGVNVGTVNGTTSGTASGSDTISSVVLTSASVGAGYNFAVGAPASVSGIEFVDANGNNTQDSGEPGLAGITIQLIGSGNTVVSSTTTGANGSYSFANLVPATYTIKEVAPSAPYFETGSALGNAGGSKSGVDTFTGVVLASGTNATGYNFAVQHFATLSGVEYNDINGNNVFDAGDIGVAGVTIQLLNASSQVVDSTTTASDGTYSFSDPPGTYTVHEVQPSGGLVETASNIGTASGNQTGVDTITNVVLGSGAIGTGYNFAVQGQVPFQAQVRLAATQLDGTPLPSVIPGGAPFWVYEYVTDLRQPTSQALGALAAYTTVTFDQTKFEVVSPITYGPNYQNNELPSGGGQPTNLQDVGALAGSQGNIPSSIGSGEQLVYKVELEAIAAGTSNIDPGQPDSTPLNPLGIILYPDPPATDALPLPTPAIHFIGLDGLQTTAPTFVSIDSPSVVINSPTNGVTTPMNFTVHLTAPLSAPVNVFYTTQETGTDTAVPGTDFVQPNYDGQHANTGEFTIPANTTQVTVPLVNAIGNSLNEADKTFHVVLTAATNNVLLSATAPSALADIESGVPLPSISVSSATGTEGGNAVFNVSLSAHSGQVVTVHYQTQATNPQSAVPGTDFGIVTGTLTFNPSDTSLTQTVTVPLPLDPNEVSSTTFQLVLSTTATSNATLANAVGLGTIQPLPTGSLSGFVYNAASANGTPQAGEPGIAGVTITLSGTDIFGRLISVSTQTKSDGSYTFTNLAQGLYVITEMQPSLYLDGSDAIGTQGGNAAVQNQFTMSLLAGQNGTGNNFGENGINPNMLWWPYF